VVSKSEIKTSRADETDLEKKTRIAEEKVDVIF